MILITTSHYQVIRSHDNRFLAPERTTTKDCQPCCYNKQSHMRLYDLFPETQVILLSYFEISQPKSKTISGNRGFIPYDKIFVVLLFQEALWNSLTYIFNSAVVASNGFAFIRLTTSRSLLFKAITFTISLPNTLDWTGTHMLRVALLNPTVSRVSLLATRCTRLSGALVRPHVKSPRESLWVHQSFFTATSYTLSSKREKTKTETLSCELPAPLFNLHLTPPSFSS
ncbi:hypothetical protein FF38_02456 [Lucilia cuprina]|uniref:Uncharacterized protein n=1 Tax=Lucilia cuprina TaxID=7375 RepID=A0A0L0CCT6_LUCCU|nr:hypothetical protein FF38_02456 [Lucilia cuprina]